MPELDGPIRILIVEDEPMQLAVLKGMLSNGSDWEIESADSLARALELLRRWPFRCVLADLNLPPHSAGLDTLHTLYEAAPALPIIVVTAISDENTTIEAIRSGAQDYFIKGSYKPEQLLRSIRFAIARAGRGRRLSDTNIRQTEMSFQLARVEKNLKSIRRSVRKVSDAIHHSNGNESILARLKTVEKKSEGPWGNRSNWAATIGTAILALLAALTAAIKGGK